MHIFPLRKLVRDFIPDYMTASGQHPQYRQLQGEERIHALQQKAAEEAIELASAKNRDEVITELADVLEVLSALQNALNISDEELQNIQKAKAEQNGTFTMGFFVESVSVEEQSPWYTYYNDRNSTT